MYIKIDQPNAADERKILELVRGEGTLSTPNLRTGFDKIEIADVEAATREALNTHISRELEEYLVQLIVATRKPEKYDGELAGMVMFGASPRATIALDRAAKTNAWLAGRDFVTPEDIHAVIYDILRHRIILSFEAQAEGVTSDINQEQEKIRSRHRRLNELYNSRYKVTSEAIIKNLEWIYGKLDADINDDGFVMNIVEIRKRMNEIDQRRLAKYDKDLLKAELMMAKATYMKIKGREWFTSEHGAGKEFDELAKTKSPEQMIEMVKKMVPADGLYE